MIKNFNQLKLNYTIAEINKKDEHIKNLVNQLNIQKAMYAFQELKNFLSLNKKYVITKKDNYCAILYDHNLDLKKEEENISLMFNEILLIFNKNITKEEIKNFLKDTIIFQKPEENIFINHLYLKNILSVEKINYQNIEEYSTLLLKDNIVYYEKLIFENKIKELNKKGKGRI